MRATALARVGIRDLDQAPVSRGRRRSTRNGVLQRLYTRLMSKVMTSELARRQVPRLGAESRAGLLLDRWFSGQEKTAECIDHLGRATRGRR